MYMKQRFTILANYVIYAAAAPPSTRDIDVLAYIEAACSTDIQSMADPP